ncbi:hypothetical protein IMCC26207_10548 [Actinobacteria bacterium IMCC26207]|nr:hypothetical protein IMCC26207_10548 [Actinobacteria bacterium IMCC26207]
MLDSVLLAHQGGWDEILMVLVPVGVFAALLFLANQRAAKLGQRKESEDEAAEVMPRKNPRGGPR